MSGNKIQISIEAYNRAKQAFDDLQRDIKGVERETAQTTQKSGISLRQLRQNWLAVTAVVAGVIATMKKMTAAYMEQEAAEMRLAMAMRNQGEFTRESFAALKEYAAELQKVTTYGDEATIAIMANLKTFGMNTEELKRATEAAMDLASAKGMDLATAADLVGKAFAGETGALSRYGIIIDSNIDKTEKFDAVLGQINSRFGGSARAELETYAGQWKQIANWWGDLAETGGLVLLKTIEAVQFAAGMVAAGFYTLLEGMLRKLRELAEQAERIPVLGHKMAGITDHLRTMEGGYTAAKESALAFADANYTMLLSFDRVERAVERMGPSGGPTITPASIDPKKAKADAAAALKAFKEMMQARADLERQLTEWSASEVEKRLLKVEDEAEKARQLASEAWDLTSPEGEAAYQEVLVEIHRAATDRKRQITADFHRFQREAEIESQIAALDLAEAEGTARRETLDERIRLTRELLAIQANYLAQLDKTKDTTAWYQQARAIEQTRKELAGLIQDRALIDPFTAMRQAMRDVHNDWSDTGRQMYNVTRDTAQAMQSAFSDFFFDSLRGELKSLGDYVDAFLRSVQRSIANTLGQQMSAGITSGITSLVSHFVGGAATAAVAPDSAAAVTGMSGYGGYPVMHGGGWVGVDTPSRYRIVPHSIFADAPRYHRGLAPDEKPAILQDGELVIPADRARGAYMRAPQEGIQTVKIEVKNESGVPMETRNSQVRFNGQEMVVSLWLDALQRNAYGLRDAIGG